MSRRLPQGHREDSQIRGLCKDFCARTTAHGFPFIGRRTLFGPHAWTLITVIAVFSFATHTYMCLSDFTQYRTLVQIRWNFDPAPFPAVTVCNLNGYKASELKNSDVLEQGRLRENLASTLAALTREKRQNLSYTLEELVLRCSFDGHDCDLNRDFRLHMDAEYGNCYTFNFNDSVLLKNDRAGPANGLRLLLNVNQSDYMPTTESAGVRVVIHEQDQEPFPDTFGYNAPTGFASSLGLRMKALHRLAPPYGMCSDSFRPAGYIYDEHYSVVGCYRSCFQHAILGRCGCGDPRLPLPSERDRPGGGWRPCNNSDPRESECLTESTKALGGFHHLTQECHCMRPCTESVFEASYSASAWPAQNFDGYRSCPGNPALANDSRACREYLRTNAANVEIYYEQLGYESAVERPEYTLVNLVSDIGVGLVLLIGFSFITCVEVFEFICEIVLYSGML